MGTFINFPALGPPPRALLCVPLLCPVLQRGHDGGDDRNKGDGCDHQAEMILYVADVPKEVADAEKERDPGHAAQDVVPQNHLQDIFPAPATKGAVRMTGMNRAMAYGRGRSSRGCLQTPGLIRIAGNYDNAEAIAKISARGHGAGEGPAPVTGGIFGG